MEISKSFWNASLEDLKRGFSEETDSFVCLLCGKEVEKGIIYPHNNILYEAERYMKVHVETSHQSVFEHFITLDKKLTGLTDHQNQLLRLFYQGKSDLEVQKELGVGSTSTVRHHRFVLKEKERQAKVFLTLMELLKENDQHAPLFIPVHKTAKMVDERYNILEDEKEQIAKKYIIKKPDFKLTKFPLKEKEKLVVLSEIIQKLESDRFYQEKELNQLLKTIFEDYALIRRYLIEYGFLDRKPDGSQYWVKK